jgi:hypothetical protein
LLDVADIAAPCAAVDGDAAGLADSWALPCGRLARCMCLKLKSVFVSLRSTLVTCGAIAMIFSWVTATRCDRPHEDAGQSAQACHLPLARPWMRALPQACGSRSTLAGGGVHSSWPPDRTYEKEDMSETSQAPPMTEDSWQCTLSGVRLGIAIDSVIFLAC